MRALVLCAVCTTLVGCGKPVELPPPPAVAPAAVPELAPVPPLVLAGDNLAPAPHAVTGDPRFKRHRDCSDPVLRGLARGEIKAGDSVEPIINGHSSYDWVRTGDYVILRLANEDAETSLIAKSGKLAYAGTLARGRRDEFFDDLTEQEHSDCWAKYADNVRNRATRTAPPPRAKP
ncbi:MAG: hypothetical protein ACKODX_06205 [Gemmata sp.]